MSDLLDDKWNNYAEKNSRDPGEYYQGCAEFQYTLIKKLEKVKKLKAIDSIDNIIKLVQELKP